MQDAIKYPIARSGSDDIIAAAESRAKFWQYPSRGPWTVYVSVGKREAVVHKDATGKVSIERR